jgi:DNA-binding MarR family transcriptional regulator
MPALSKSDFEQRSEFRYRLTCFFRFGEHLAVAAGLTLPQYLLLLHTKGMKGRSWALVGELAQRMQLRHHSTVELVTRCESAGLVERRRSEADRREVQIHLTQAGDRVVRRVASGQTEELFSLIRGMGFDERTGLLVPLEAQGDSCKAVAAGARSSGTPRKRRPAH